MWPDRRYLDLVGITQPIIQAPMAGANLAEMAIAVSRAGGLGSLPCGMLSLAAARSELECVRQQTRGPINANFFCHTTPPSDPARESRWQQRLSPYYAELGLDPGPAAGARRAPFDAAMCALVVELRPRVVSFHYGLPEAALLARLKAAGAIIQGSATTVEEARWLEAHGADAIIAQGFEAGGHRGMFLTRDLGAQVGTLALVPQVVDAVRVPVIAAGAIADARGIVAALALGASAVQIGTAYLLCHEAKISQPFRAALRAAGDQSTVLTNVFSGRPARSIRNRLISEVGPISSEAPPFPLAAASTQPLRLGAEARGSTDFSPLLAGQAAALARETGAAALTLALANEARSLLARLAELGANPALIQASRASD
ncbi:MAG TPA: nitronate monooxygenase [Hyphomicrobiaceae bacterium]|nr:nitronate monooxygenase [Hyphomicrobiaceae bacterium]